MWQFLSGLTGCEWLERIGERVLCVKKFKHICEEWEVEGCWLWKKVCERERERVRWGAEAKETYRIIQEVSVHGKSPFRNITHEGIEKQRDEHRLRELDWQTKTTNIKQKKKIQKEGK